MREGISCCDRVKFPFAFLCVSVIYNLRSRMKSTYYYRTRMRFWSMNAAFFRCYPLCWLDFEHFVSCRSSTYGIYGVRHCRRRFQKRGWGTKKNEFLETELTSRSSFKLIIAPGVGRAKLTKKNSGFHPSQPTVGRDMNSLRQ
jgi:hypothetical protein